MEQKYSLWVGGVEVNDYELNKEQVLKLEREYITAGYIDIAIEVLN